MTESQKHCTWVDDRLDAYIDGDLPKNQCTLIEAHTRACPHCADALALAVQIRDQLRTWPVHPCPSAITDRVYRQVGNPSSWRHRLQTWLSGWQPLTGAVAAVVLIIAAVALFQSQRPPQTNTTELAQMQRQAKWTLVYLNQIGRRTSHTLRDQVLKERVLKPVAKNLTKRL